MNIKTLVSKIGLSLTDISNKESRGVSIRLEIKRTRELFSKLESKVKLYIEAVNVLREIQGEGYVSFPAKERMDKILNKIDSD